MIKPIVRDINKKLFWLTYKFKPIYMPFFPNSICINASTNCNLNCVSCHTGQGRKGLAKGYLKFDDFKKFIDKNEYFLTNIFLSNWGEIFLNPDIFKIISYATSKDIQIKADSNLNYLNGEMANKLVKSGMTELTVSIDGASNKSYKKYRKGGDFNKVISNIKEINKIKLENNSGSPKLIWKFIVFEHNKHEIKKAREMARNLNMEFRLDSNWDPSFSQPLDLDKEIYHGYDTGFCFQIWHQPVINFNGNMLGCCIFFDEKYSLGNVFEKGFFKIYNGNKMRNLRKSVLGRTKYPLNTTCLCCLYSKRSDCTISLEQYINMYRLFHEVLSKKVNGDVVELGVYEGRTAILTQKTLEHLKSKKKLHVYDSFKGLPEKSSGDGNSEFKKGDLRCTKEKLMDNFRLFGVSLPQIHEGWFKETIPQKLPKKIAFAHLDGDFYESIKQSLEGIYPRMSKGGIIIIDDYFDKNVHKGKEILPGVRKACDEFFKNKKEKVIPLPAGDKAHGYVRKL